jgi:hypothetical protein
MGDVDKVTPSQLPSPSTLNRLCHVVALSKEGKGSQALDGLIVALIAGDASSPLSSASQVTQAIHRTYGLHVPVARVQSSLDRSLNSGQLLRDRASTIFMVPPAIQTHVQERAAEAVQLEQAVRTEFAEIVVRRVGQIPTELIDGLWHCLQVYIARLFSRHGAETVLLLNPSMSIRNGGVRAVNSYLEDAVKESQCGLAEDLVLDLIQEFFLDPSPSRTRYVSQIMDLTFNVYALTMDKNISIALKGNIPNLFIFLDTNVIFGLLDLHAHPLIDVSREILELISKHKLPFRLFYHPETLREAERTLYYISERLCGKGWTQELSRAAVTVGNLSGIELRYHEMNAQFPISADAFLSKYSHVQDLLSDLGIAEYRIGEESEGAAMKRHTMVEEYRGYVKERRPNRPKPYAVLNHDIAVWQTVQSLRGTSRSLLDVKALFLSCDYLFYHYDWQRLRSRGGMGSIVIPSQLLQVLRAFLPVDDDFDRKFVEALTIPEFRTLGGDYSTTASSVLSYLALYKDLREETAVRILTDEALMSQLREVEETSADFKEAIENAVINHNQDLLDRVENLRRDAHEYSRREQEMHAQIRETLTSREEAERALQEQKALLESQQQVAAEALRREAEAARRADAAEGDRQAAEEVGRREKEERELQLRELSLERDAAIRRVQVWKRLIIAILIVPFAWIVVLQLPNWVNWTWFVQHQNRYGLQMSVMVIVAGLGAVYVRPDWSGRILLGVVVVFASVVAQILGGPSLMRP